VSKATGDRAAASAPELANGFTAGLPYFCERCRELVEPGHGCYGRRYRTIVADPPWPYEEMFSRRARLGWDTWGDEALHGTELVA
jgi:hypothetical protein